MQRRRLPLFVALLILAISLPIAMADGYSRNPKLASTLVISADGTWSGTVTLSGQAEAKFEGKWVTDKDFIYWVYTKSSTPQVKVGARDKDRLVETGADHFEVETRTNRRRTYFRVK